MLLKIAIERCLHRWHPIIIPTSHQHTYRELIGERLCEQIFQTCTTEPISALTFISLFTNYKYRARKKAGLSECALHYCACTRLQKHWDEELEDLNFSLPLRTRPPRSGFISIICNSMIYSPGKPGTPGRPAAKEIHPCKRRPP